MSDLKSRISEATKAAMKARDKARVAALRMVNADIQCVEVDERRELSDEDVLTVLNRMIKQRNDALNQYREAGRDELADQECFEIEVIRTFLPEPLSEDALDELISATVSRVGAESMKDMGKVMAGLKDVVQGRADMGAVSAKVKAILGA